MATPSYSFPQYLLEGLTSLQETAEKMERDARTWTREIAAHDESEAQDTALSEINDLRRSARWVAGAAERAVQVMDEHNKAYANQLRLDNLHSIRTEPEGAA